MTATSRNWRAWLICVFLGLVLTVSLTLASGFVSGIGAWYSECPNLRLQTQAFEHGAVSLGTNVYDLHWDQAWGNGIQQVWGLGVPAFRFVAESFASPFSRKPFPDRITFLIAYFMCAVAFARTILEQNYSPGERFWKMQRAMCVMILVLLPPPLITLLQTRFLDYEEVVAYGYLHSVVLFIALLRTAQQPTVRRLLFLSAWAGFGPFIRPTLLFYSIITGILAIAIVWPARDRWRRISSMTLVFGATLVLLCWSNHMRFGGITEFGHSLNLEDSLNHNTFALKFGYPFQNEPLWPAVRDELGTLFFVNFFNPDNFYIQNCVAGQSPTYRWHEMYFSVFDRTYLCLLAVSVAVWAWNWPRIRAAWTRASNVHSDPVARGIDSTGSLLAVPWGVGSFLGLFAFYLRSPSMASRYNVDFLAAVMVVIAALIWNFLEFTPVTRKRTATMILAVLTATWFAVGLMTSEVTPTYRGRALSYQEISSPTLSDLEVRAPLRRYEINAPPPEDPIPFNGYNWNLTNGIVDASVTLFATDPECVALSLFSLSGEPIHDADLMPIRAKIGLEYLHLEESIVRSNKATMIFAGPRRSRYQKGLQLCFLGFIRPADLGSNQPNVGLSSVSFERPAAPNKVSGTAAKNQP
jgi:hypothetical protein